MENYNSFQIHYLGNTEDFVMRVMLVKYLNIYP
jgi:hypothetical protein